MTMRIMHHWFLELAWALGTATPSDAMQFVVLDQLGVSVCDGSPIGCDTLLAIYATMGRRPGAFIA